MISEASESFGGLEERLHKDRAKELLHVTLLARQRDYKNKAANFWQRLLDRLRKPIEGVISVLTEGFDVEHPLVRSDIGLYRRTQAKATAFLT